MKTRFQTKLENLGRRYYEVFGDLEAQQEFLKLVSLMLLCLLFFAVFGAFALAKRPPVVIRVEEVGKAEAISDIAAHNAPSAPEILYFSRTFVKRYAEYNAYTVSRDMAEAWNLMSARFQSAAKRSLIESGILARIEEAKLYASLEFKEEKIERETPEHVLVSLVWVRTLKSYKDPDHRDASLLKSELVLKKIPRSLPAPSGLLVEDYKEILLNRLEENKR
jgi:hypothetical protein